MPADSTSMIGTLRQYHQAHCSNNSRHIALATTSLTPTTKDLTKDPTVTGTTTTAMIVQHYVKHPIPPQQVMLVSSNSHAGCYPTLHVPANHLLTPNVQPAERWVTQFKHVTCLLWHQPQTVHAKSSIR